ncbi:MAG: hypothetical protein MJ184_07050 [Treponema sp.]|uniref:hypothetical protein n=1 Tax=Treponema sp. TaxID=166 RepID=UPI00298EA7E8|nr:hypothetical protein [Treponema sp.]MCQ2601103.1 hypothetical protein [Treponema sp.]
MKKNMLVEKKSWKNLIKPVILSIAVIVTFMSLVKIGLFICDYDSGKYAFLEVPIFLVLFFIILKIGIEKIDFEQVVKVEDLSTLNDYELWEYRKNFGDDISLKTKYEEEYLRCCAEMSARKKSSKVKIEINKSYFNEIMNYISDSNVIPSRIKESLKEDILGTYSKRGEHDLPHEYFITSQENAAVFKAAYNEVETVNKGYGDYGFIYEYENWK